MFNFLSNISGSTVRLGVLKNKTFTQNFNQSVNFKSILNQTSDFKRKNIYYRINQLLQNYNLTVYIYLSVHFDLQIDLESENFHLLQKFWPVVVLYSFFFLLATVHHKLET